MHPAMHQQPHLRGGLLRRLRIRVRQKRLAEPGRVCGLLWWRLCLYTLLQLRRRRLCAFASLLLLGGLDMAGAVLQSLRARHKM